MSGHGANGASQHFEPHAPYVSRLTGQALEDWLTTARERRDALVADLVEVSRRAQGLHEFGKLRVAALQLADRLHAAAAAELERIESEISEFDAETERLLAESNGVVRKSRALLAHMTAPGPKPGLPNDADALERMRQDVKEAEAEDQRRLSARSEMRRAISERWMKAGATVLDTSLRVLALSEPDRLALVAAGERAERLRQELETTQKAIEVAETNAQA